MLAHYHYLRQLICVLTAELLALPELKVKAKLTTCRCFPVFVLSPVSFTFMTLSHLNDASDGEVSICVYVCIQAREREERETGRERERE